jgi:putative nucleotidyltransferase with HDIG domain
MINPPEPKQSAARRPTEEIQPERQYVLKYLTSLLGIRYQWYLVFFVVVLGLFVFSPYFTALVGLKALLGWQSLYYTSIYRLIYQLCIAIIAWRFGVRKGIIACLVLIVVIYLPFITGLHKGFLLIDVGLVLLGFVISAVLGRQGDMARRLFQSRSDLQLQTEQLKQEITERLKAEKELRTLSLGAIESLVFALEAKDKYSAGHSRRVTRIAMAIGKRMNLSEEDMEDLRYGSLLHDVGKIAVDQLVQNKASTLTPNEYAHIMIHVRAGAEIVKPIVNSKVVALIEHHHDQYESDSTEQTLTGEDIPLGARIIALADAFDAMTSNRPYRAAMSPAVAIREIQDYKGTQFDPVVVDAFLEIPPAEINAIIENKGEQSP